MKSKQDYEAAIRELNAEKNSIESRIRVAENSPNPDPTINLAALKSRLSDIPNDIDNQEDLADKAASDQRWYDELARKVLLHPSTAHRCKDKSEFNKYYAETLKEAIREDKAFDEKSLTNTENMLASAAELQSRPGATGKFPVSNPHLLTIIDKMDAPFAKQEIEKAGHPTEQKLAAAGDALHAGYCSIHGECSKKEAIQAMRDDPQKLRDSENAINKFSPTAMHKNLHLDEFYKQTTEDMKKIGQEIRNLPPEEKAKIRATLHQIKEAGHDAKKLDELQKQSGLSSDKFKEYAGLVDTYQTWRSANYDDNGNVKTSTANPPQTSVSASSLPLVNAPGRSASVQMA